jgi:hypothetical protein
MFTTFERRISETILESLPGAATLFITALASDKISAPASRKSSSENSAFTPAPDSVDRVFGAP